jgi:hypothetical protein
MVVSTLKVVDEYFDKLRTVTEKKALQASLASIARKADDRFDSLGYSTSVMKMTEGTSVALGGEFTGDDCKIDIRTRWGLKYDLGTLILVDLSFMFTFCLLECWVIICCSMLCMRFLQVLVVPSLLAFSFCPLFFCTRVSRCIQTAVLRFMTRTRRLSKG